MDFLSRWITESWGMMVASAPWLLGGFALAGVIHVAVPFAAVSRHLSQPGLLGVIKAALVGIPLPLCSCSVIPVASELRKRGASKGATAAFLISTPETGVDSVAITYSLLGPVVAIARPVGALITTLVAGTLINALDRDDEFPSPEKTSPDAECGCSSSDCCAPPDDDSRRGALVEALRYGMVEMFADLSHWLAIGFLLGGLLSALLPAGFLEEHVGSGIPAMLLMLVVGLPTYVCATSSTPVAAALVAGGLSPGAALVFLLAGPATNMATMVVVLKELGARSLVIYLLSISLVAVACGLALDWLARDVLVIERSTCVSDHVGTGSALAGITLVALMVNGLRIGVRRAR